MVKTLLRLSGATAALPAADAAAAPGIDDRIQSVLGPVADWLSGLGSAAIAHSAVRTHESLSEGFVALRCFPGFPTCTC